MFSTIPICYRSIYRHTFFTVRLNQRAPPSITSIYRLTATFIIFVFFVVKESEEGMYENRLLNKLLEKYNPLERPVAMESEALNVTFGLTLQQIIDVDEKNQILTTNAWLNLEWVDYNLQWNVSENGGVKDLRITPKTIWRPDILMYNSADEKFDGTFHTNVVVRHNGTCIYIPPGIFKSTCKIDITWFPFDDQHCNMKFGSWTYDGFQVDLILKSEEGGDLSNFITNGEWHLLGMPGKKNTVSYQCCPEPYVDITFIIQIRRRTLYYFFNLIVPCVLISSMALLGFTLPPDSGEKLTLGTYFNCIMFMVASSVVLTVVVLNYHHRTSANYRMPPLTQAIFLQWLPWCLRMNRPGRKITLKTIRMSNKMKHMELKERTSRSLMANVLDMDDDIRHCNMSNTGHTSFNTNLNSSFIRSSSTTGSLHQPHQHSGRSGMGIILDDSEGCPSTQKDLQLILKEIKFITNRMRRIDEEAEIISDWKYAAIVIDRLCLLIFTLFTIIATLVVLFSAPHIIVQ